MGLVHALKLLVLAVWAAMTPRYDRAADADAIATAIAQVVAADGSRAPVMSSHAEDAALMAVYAARESMLDDCAVHAPISDWDHPSYGVWQEGPQWRGKPISAQARAWMYLLREGARICPESPAAPLSGGCTQARKLADRRVREARELLVVAMQR